MKKDVSCINCKHLFRNSIWLRYECHIKDTTGYMYEWPGCEAEKREWIVENPAKKNIDNQCKDFKKLFSARIRRRYWKSRKVRCYNPSTAIDVLCVGFGHDDNEAQIRGYEHNGGLVSKLLYSQTDEICDLP